MCVVPILFSGAHIHSLNCMQEPFHTLNSELLKTLLKPQCEQLDLALPKFDLESLLNILYEFIETFIRHIDMGKKEWG